MVIVYLSSLLTKQFSMSTNTTLWSNFGLIKKLADYKLVTAVVDN